MALLDYAKKKKDQLSAALSQGASGIKSFLNRPVGAAGQAYIQKSNDFRNKFVSNIANTPQFNFSDSNVLQDRPLLQLGAQVAEGTLNIPSRLMQNYGKTLQAADSWKLFTPTGARQFAARTGENVLDIASLGKGKAGLQAGKQVINKLRTAQPIKEMLIQGGKQGLKTGAGYGAAYGSLNEAQQENTSLKSIASRGIEGGMSGALAGGALGFGLPAIGATSRALKNSIANRRPGAITTESLPGRWVRQGVTELPDVSGKVTIPQATEGTRYIGGPFKTRIDPVTQSQRYGIHTEKYLPPQTVERGRKTPTVGELFRSVRDAAPRPGMSIKAVDNPILQEARKYKSAEEFVNGTKDSIKKIPLTGRSKKYLSELFQVGDSNIYIGYKKTGKVSDVMRDVFDRSGKSTGKMRSETPEIDFRVFQREDGFSAENSFIKAQRSGKGGITTLDELPKALKSQLTDLWNKANKADTPNPLLQEARKLTPEQQAQKSFLENFNKTYNSGPATVKMETALDKSKAAAKLAQERSAYIQSKAGEPKSYSAKDIADYNKKAIKAGKEFDLRNMTEWDARAAAGEVPFDKPNPLFEEARKYKSAEEFVNSFNLMKSGEVTSIGQLPISKVNKTQIRAITERGLPHTDTGLKVKDFTPGRKVTQPLEVYSKGGSYVVENGNHRLAQALANGDTHIPVVFKRGEGKTYSTHTKSQLTDLWKKAHGGKEQNKTTASVRIPSEKLTIIGGRKGATSTRQPRVSASTTGLSENTPEMSGFPEKQTTFSARVSGENNQVTPAGYRVSSNENVLQKAQANVGLGLNFALKQARNQSLGAEANATAMALVDDAIKRESWDEVDMLVKEFSPRFSKQGQEIQILSRWGRLTPSGAINYAQHIIDKATQATGVNIKFTSEAKKEIADLANKALAAPEGSRERVLAAAVLMRKIAEQVPSSIGRKIATIQTMMQLLNPKTAIRNIGGNLGFAAGEAISDVVATPLDMATSLFTGKRTKTLPSLPTMVRGFGSGAKEGFQEAKLGIDVKNLPSQFDVQNTPTFTGKVGSGLEKALAFELKASDRAFYQAAYDDSLRQQMKFAGVSEPTPEMLDVAHADGLYRTFQDESKAAKLFSYIKKGLNLGMDWGLGDIVLKYPKTPGNLLARAIDYSPAGYVKGMMELMRPAFGQQFNQKAFVESLSRGTVGSVGLIGMGMILGKLGLVTGQQNDDKDINNLQRGQGGGAYRLNTTALKRYILSGFDAKEAKPREGDRLMTYDWFQPFAIPISIGANAVQKKKQAYSSVAAESLASGVDTLANQPLVQGMKRMFGYGDVTGGVIETAKGAPSSFVPTLLSQIRQYSDNAKRQLSGGGFRSELYASVANKIPGLEAMLPQAYDTLGRQMEMYQNGGNSFFNVFLNPAFVSQIETTPGGREVMDIYNRSGETQQAPRTAPSKLKINGVDMELSADQITEYQKYIGERTSKAFDQLSTNQEFQKLGDEDKAKYMANVMTDIATAAKVELFGHQTQDWREERAGQYMNSQDGYDFQFKDKAFDSSIKKSRSKLTSYKKLGDVENWLKESEKLYAEYGKALQSGELPEEEALKIRGEMKTIETQFNKYKGYKGFTKPKTGGVRKQKTVKIDTVDNSPSFIVKSANAKMRPLRSFSRSRTNLASVRRPNIRRPKKLA